MFDPLFWCCLVWWRKLWQLYLDLLPLLLRSYGIGCACILRTVVVIVTNCDMLHAWFNLHLTVCGLMFAMIVLMRYNDSPDLISINIHTDPQIPMLKYKSNCTSQTNRFDLAGTLGPGFEREPLNAFDCIRDILAMTLEEEALEAYYWEQSDIPLAWNLYWTKSTEYGGSLDLDDPGLRDSWTKYWGAHAWFNYDPEEPCQWEGNNCLGTHSMERDVPAAVAKAKAVPIPLIVIEPPTPTPSQFNPYIWHCFMCLICIDVTIRTARPGGHFVLGWSGHHKSTWQHEATGHGLRGETDDARYSTTGAEECGTASRTRELRTEGLRSSSTDNLIIEPDHRPTGRAASAPQCDHTEMETRIQVLTTEQDTPRRRPAAPRTDEELWERLQVMTRNAQQSREEVHGLRTQLANAATLAARAAS